MSWLVGLWELLRGEGEELGGGRGPRLVLQISLFNQPRRWASGFSFLSQHLHYLPTFSSLHLLPLPDLLYPCNENSSWIRRACTGHSKWNERKSSRGLLKFDIIEKIESERVARGRSSAGLGESPRSLAPPKLPTFLLQLSLQLAVELVKTTLQL